MSVLLPVMCHLEKICCSVMGGGLNGQGRVTNNAFPDKSGIRAKGLDLRMKRGIALPRSRAGPSPATQPSGMMSSRAPGCMWQLNIAQRRGPFGSFAELEQLGVVIGQMGRGSGRSRLRQC